MFNDPARRSVRTDQLSSWDDRMDQLKIVFKRADGKRTTSSIIINRKWFADANITGMTYLTKGTTWIPKGKIYELFQML